MAARLKEKYNSEIKSALQKDLGLENIMAVPKLEKIVINMGLGEATQNVKIMDPLLADLGSIAGQKPVITKAKKPPRERRGFSGSGTVDPLKASKRAVAKKK